MGRRRSQLVLCVRQEPAACSSFDLFRALDLSSPGIERLQVKRLRSVEAKVLYPVVDVVFCESGSGCCGLAQRCGDDARIGLYQAVQTVEPEAACRETSAGYLVFAFKTMEDMAKKAFVAQWKTWTGARLFRSALDDRIPFGRISFYRRGEGLLDFMFVLIIEMPTFFKNSAPILNALNLVRPRVNAFIGCFRESKFTVCLDELVHRARKVHPSLEGRLRIEHLIELESENVMTDDVIETTTLRVRVCNNTAILSASGHRQISRARLADVADCGNSSRSPSVPPEPAPSLALRKTETTQTDAGTGQGPPAPALRSQQTQTEHIDLDHTNNNDNNSLPDCGPRLQRPLNAERRHSICSIPRSEPIHDFATLFADETHRQTERKSRVHFVDDVEQDWQALSDELDSHYATMLRKSRKLSNSTMTIRPANEDSSQFFTKLREKYFNSPDLARPQRRNEQLPAAGGTKNCQAEE